MAKTMECGDDPIHGKQISHDCVQRCGTCHTDDLKGTSLPQYLISLLFLNIFHRGEFQVNHQNKNVNIPDYSLRGGNDERL